MMVRRASDQILEAFNTFIGASEQEIYMLGAQLPLPMFDPQICLELCYEALEVLRVQGPVVELSGPIYVVGDLHGNLHDLFRIFNKIYENGDWKIIFLGDYIDRGQYSLEVVLLLFTLLCKYPSNIVLIRGNHEFPSVGLKNFLLDELKSAYANAQEIYDAMHSAFSWMPLAAIVNNNILCLHGGISPHLTCIDDIRNINYPLIDYSEKLVADILWSDPCSTIMSFIDSTRGVGVFFGVAAITSFLSSNKLKCLIRAHQCVIDGIELSCDAVYTVFSSSFYSDEENRGGYIYINENSELSFFSIAPFRSIKRDKASFYEVSPSRALRTRMLSIGTYKGVNPLVASNVIFTPQPRKKKVALIMTPTSPNSNNVSKFNKRKRQNSFSATFVGDFSLC